MAEVDKHNEMWKRSQQRIYLHALLTKQEGYGTSLVAQWLRIHLPLQETRVWSLIQEDPTCHGATKPISHNYWACALEPMLHNKRSYRNEKPAHRNEE